jgi:PKD repeat protein
VGAVLLTGALLGGAPALASADTVINFDPPVSGPVTNQYQAQGVVFGLSSSLKFPGSPGPGDCGAPNAQSANSPSPLPSPPNVAQLQTCAPVGAGNFSGTFAKFTDAPRGTLSVEVALTSRFADTPVTVTGYDSSGNQVATASGTASDTRWTQITVTQSGGSSITYFEIATSSASTNIPPLAIDDLTFPAAGGGPPPPPPGPNASVSLLTANPHAGNLISFSGAGSTAGSGHIIAYNWGFDNNNTTTSTGTNPVAHWIFKPGFHTVTLTVTNSDGQHSTTHLGFTNAPPPISLPQPDGGQGDCQPTYDDGDVHIVADCIQTLSGGGYVIQTQQLLLNGMVLAPAGGGYGIFKILPFKNLGVGSGTNLTGPVSDIQLLNTPIGDVTFGSQDLTSNPMELTFQAFHPPTVLHFQHDRRTRADDRGPRAKAAGANSKTLLMTIGVAKACSGNTVKPGCCPPPGPTSACATLPGGFPLTGTVNIYKTGNGDSLFDVNVGLDLSAVNFQATGSLEIQADPVNGINLNSLQFTIPQAGLANIFQVQNASFTYYFPSDPDPSKRDSWQAKGTIVFGPLSQPSLAGELDFKQGQFQKASMLFTAPSGTGIPIYPGILLNQIGATVGVNPFEFGGQLGASIATQLELSLAFLYQEPTDTQLGFFGGQGQLSFRGDKIATLAADVYSDGYTDAALDIDLHFPFDSTSPVVSVTGHIGFWDEPSSGRWEADGSVGFKLWVISAEVAALVNNNYIAGCADIAGFGVQGRYSFIDNSIDGGFFGFSNCTDQLKQYKQTPVTPHTGGFVSSAADVSGNRRLTAADTRGGGTVRLPGGTSGQELLIDSASGTPVVTIYTPDHKVYTTPVSPGQISTVGGEFIAAIAPNTHQVIVFLRHPHGGLYNIQPTSSSAPITSVAAARDVPPAVLHVKIKHRRGRRLLLKYKIKNFVHGTQIQFVARGPDSTSVIGTARNARGTIKFVPQDAIGRHRKIYAYLRSSSGAPLRTMLVGSFLAPPAIRPGRIARAHFSRGAGDAVLSWSSAPGTREYRVKITGSDGRVVTEFISSGRRHITVSEVLPTERFAATITPLGGPNLLPGRTAHAKLAAASTGLVELLKCSHGACSGQLVAGSLVLSGREIHATLSRGGRAVATGIASNGKPNALSLTVARKLRAGHYRVTLKAGRRALHRTIRIR